MCITSRFLAQRNCSQYDWSHFVNFVLIHLFIVQALTGYILSVKPVICCNIVGGWMFDFEEDYNIVTLQYISV